nr:DNA phosphorothioation-associated putative methyltransferase [Sedimenticola hydrogenitrophicus]
MALEAGKQLPDAVYLHKTALETASNALFNLTYTMATGLKIADNSWNIAKFNKRDFKITLLHYPQFDSYAYPALHESHTIDLSKFSVRKANYSSSDNPPILHRKETFVLKDYPLFKYFEEITKEGEAANLYEKPRTIGFKTSWERLIRSKGYFLDDSGRLHRRTELANQNIDVALPSNKIERHKTAIDRNQLSAPMQILARHGYFYGEHSVLDYGCGKGDDVRELEAHGIDASGWDPVHNPEGDLETSDIVNLGFVLNVIEDIEERNETLRRAYGYATKILIVSVMVAGESTIQQFTPYKDGIITSRNTFQRYYAQAEFKEYVESTLNVNAIAVGQGIFIVFRDELEEQHFLLERQHVKRDWQQKTQRELKTDTNTITIDTIEKHQELFDHFWDTTLDLGRIPANSEFEFSVRIRTVAGSHKKAIEALLEQRGKNLYLEAQQARINDLLVYFALSQFEKRKPYSQMPEGLKRDIKVFFENYKEALDEATRLLFSVGEPYVIEEVANRAYKLFLIGEFNEGHSWIIPKELLTELPPELRIYVGCACQIYGDLEGIHLIKIHFTSGKVSLLRYDDFEKKEPLLIQRIKIKIRDLDVDFFEYVDNFAPPPLMNKSVFY